MHLRLPEHQHQPQARDVETDRDHVRRKRAVEAVVSIVEAAFEPPARLGHLVGRHARGQPQHLRERGAVAEQPPRLTDPPPRAVARDGRADLLFQDATGPAQLAQAVEVRERRHVRIRSATGRKTSFAISRTASRGVQCWSAKTRLRGVWPRCAKIWPVLGRTGSIGWRTGLAFLQGSFNARLRSFTGLLFRLVRTRCVRGACALVRPWSGSCAATLPAARVPLRWNVAFIPRCWRIITRSCIVACCSCVRGVCVAFISSGRSVRPDVDVAARCRPNSILGRIKAVGLAGSRARSARFRAGLLRPVRCSANARFRTSAREPTTGWPGPTAHLFMLARLFRVGRESPQLLRRPERRRPPARASQGSHR